MATDLQVSSFVLLDVNAFYSWKRPANFKGIQKRQYDGAGNLNKLKSKPRFFLPSLWRGESLEIFPLKSRETLFFFINDLRSQ